MKFLLLFFASTIICSKLYSQTEGYVLSGDSKIYYRTFGSGKPLLIINGGPGMNSDGFVDLAKALSKNNETIIYDQRGTGKSVLPKVDKSTVTMLLMVRDIDNLRKHLKIKKWAVLGHSFGGMLASYYATLYPQNIESLILSSSGGIDLGLLSYVGARIQSKLSLQEKDSLLYWNKKISNGDTSFFARLHRGLALAPAYLYNRKNVPAIAERLTQGVPVVNDLVWQDMQRIKFDCKKNLSHFNKPVLIIQGQQDIIEEQTAVLEHNVLMNSKLVLIDHCVHYGWLDRPDVYFKEVENFLANN
ncbi:MAG: alpha/beta fold hydrolase [Ginsengibacter sp.]